MSQINIAEETGAVKGRYVAHVGDAPEAELVFTRLGSGVMRIDHVGVPLALEGKGVGKALVGHAVAAARVGGFKIEPRCPFALALFKRHPEWADVVEN